MNPRGFSHQIQTLLSIFLTVTQSYTQKPSTRFTLKLHYTRTATILWQLYLVGTLPHKSRKTGVSFCLSWVHSSWNQSLHIIFSLNTVCTIDYLRYKIRNIQRLFSWSKTFHTEAPIYTLSPHIFFPHFEFSTFTLPSSLFCLCICFAVEEKKLQWLAQA